MAISSKQARSALRSEVGALAGTCAGWHSRLAARRITQFLDRELAASGFTTAQLGLMAQIAAAADDRIGALARRMDLDQSTLSRTLRTLEGDGLVEIAVVEQDQRRRAVWLTETGLRRLEAALPVWRTAQQKLAGLIRADLARILADDTAALASTAGS